MDKEGTGKRTETQVYTKSGLCPPWIVTSSFTRGRGVCAPEEDVELKDEGPVLLDFWGGEVE